MHQHTYAQTLTRMCIYVYTHVHTHARTTFNLLHYFLLHRSRHFLRTGKMASRNKHWNSLAEIGCKNFPYIFIWTMRYDILPIITTYILKVLRVFVLQLSSEKQVCIQDIRCSPSSLCSPKRKRYGLNDQLTDGPPDRRTHPLATKNWIESWSFVGQIDRQTNRARDRDRGRETDTYIIYT